MPAGQNWHSSMPSELAYLPVSQVVQEGDPLAAYLPVEHLVQAPASPSL
jgi:hypothetical protein